MATLLWRRFYVDLRDSPSFDALLKSSPDGILDNVKELVITNVTVTRNSSQQHRKYSNLLKLFGVLPRDGLSSLESIRFKFDPALICVLMRCQSKLRKLDIIADESTFEYLPISCIRGNLLELEALWVDVFMGMRYTYENMSTWFDFMPNLREMIVAGRWNAPVAVPNFFEGWALTTPLGLLKLHTLDMRKISLPSDPAPITAHLDFPSLRHLKFTHCTNTDPFLSSLTEAYVKTAGAPLETYCYSADVSPKDALLASANLIELCTGLKYVQLTGITGSILDLQCLGSSGRSLSKLALNSNMITRDPFYYSAEDLKEMAVLCPNLRILSICLCDLASYVDDLDWTDPFRLTNNYSNDFYIDKLVSSTV